jgi:hypothetical protein
MKLNVFKYVKEVLDENRDNGRIVENVEKLETSVIGRRIVSAERQQIKQSGSYWRTGPTVFVITLDNGDQVQMFDTEDCCAHTTLENFLLHPQSVDHVILGVGTTEEYTTWHIYADFGDILALEVD